MTRIDWQFIGDQEGEAWTNGYVPTTMGQYLGTAKYDEKEHGRPLGQSGVTIATGFDIGQRNEWELMNLGLSEDLRIKLKPYTLLKKMEAILQLEKTKGLTISADQAAAVDAAVKGHTIRKLTSNYNLVAASKKKLNFEQLPDEIQTAIASFAFQYGNNVSNPMEPARSYWTLVTSQDFEAAASLLEKQNQYMPRRRKEADLMRKGLTKLKIMRTGQ